jgi:hypothetical protein
MFKVFFMSYADMSELGELDNDVNRGLRNSDKHGDRKNRRGNWQPPHAETGSEEDEGVY